MYCSQILAHLPRAGPPCAAKLGWRDFYDADWLCVQNVRTVRTVRALVVAKHKSFELITLLAVDTNSIRHAAVQAT
jgi:hypothetical protein